MHAVGEAWVKGNLDEAVPSGGTAIPLPGDWGGPPASFKLAAELAANGVPDVIRVAAGLAGRGSWDEPAALANEALAIVLACYEVCGVNG